jgi:hypothetical protein
VLQLIVPVQRTGGVYDFACRLQASFGEAHASLVHLGPDNLAAWQVRPDDVVILQMSGYGFQKRGVPLWLLHELEARRDAIKTLGIFFHELYAFGPPWSSSFWLSPVQRHIARQLARIADFWLTSREGSARWLLPRAPGKPHQVLPIFSAMGEAAKYGRPRAARIIVFGSPGMRQRAYRAAGKRLLDWATRAKLELHDIGSPLPDEELTQALRAHGTVFHGRLDADRVGELLSVSAFGLLAYSTDFIAKSSIFAAYCAHGVCPVVISDDYAQADGLIQGIQYIAGIPNGEFAADCAQRIGNAAWDWYQPHRLQRHVDALRRLAPFAKE